jgi:hypothetical protein
MFLTFLAPIGLMGFHRAMFGNALAYIKFNSGQQGLIGLPPFPELYRGRISTRDVVYLHSFLDFYGLYFLGVLFLLPKAGPVGVFAAVHLAYVALIRHTDLFRYALPAGVFALLIGFDGIWSHRLGYTAVVVTAPLYVIEMMIYASGQIHSNRCSDGFLDSVFDAAIDHIH